MQRWCKWWFAFLMLYLAAFSGSAPLFSERFPRRELYTVRAGIKIFLIKLYIRVSKKWNCIFLSAQSASSKMYETRSNYLIMLVWRNCLIGLKIVVPLFLRRSLTPLEIPIASHFPLFRVSDLREQKMSMRCRLLCRLFIIYVAPAQVFIIYWKNNKSTSCHFLLITTQIYIQKWVLIHVHAPQYILKACKS
jgi:hypothetical protein